MILWGINQAGWQVRLLFDQTIRTIYEYESLELRSWEQAL
jgi:hypothetical protein